ncbi:hypothetical protein [Synechococcus sp. A15-44]|uniref:hypothetical protein n=1 Tax=Synechococcus sp. A15-44 TaxID=1050646 RepID=UPI001647DAB0|nr:hypothetical protein [Synechococcus sp. A15-44]
MKIRLQAHSVANMCRADGPDQRLPRFFLEFFSAFCGNRKSQDIVSCTEAAIGGAAHGEQGFSHHECPDSVAVGKCFLQQKPDRFSACQRRAAVSQNTVAS